MKLNNRELQFRIFYSMVDDFVSKKLTVINMEIYNENAGDTKKTC